MKRLKLSLQNIEGAEVFSREQLKKYWFNVGQVLMIVRPFTVAILKFIAPQLKWGITSLLYG